MGLKLNCYIIFDIIYDMNIYLDESYNLQKSKGKMFISINGFSVLHDEALRKRWKLIRKSFAQTKRRIHATDSHFEKLREKSIKLLGKNDVNILSVFQLTQEIPYTYFDKKEMKFDSVYADLLKKLFIELSIGEYKKVKIIIDARKHKGGRLGEKIFKKEIEDFLNKQFNSTASDFIATPSYADILIELADFISNTLYKEYSNGTNHVFKSMGYRLIQIKNPL
ncbi:MAG: hypothetical protein A2537_01205 [Candidatus Magasanikbacteria bacterium RIFOXYD2_FULL_36_9]|uniref:DUF3800 domain-containing protein n=1 Tax=Candidatus Magasanikbacteria bacterium RIFOXYD2_FULL_36_9 TaxID=1798707 RepID=A0A1F6NYV7_9BACT|nr:MAG: hypothetical protein A2537_01205 [Candidatus Magasanikbacteria bacterium RIFOXYD2_FULL_36_9]